MTKDKDQTVLPIWKPFVFGLATPIVVKLLHLWLSEPIAWGIGAFLAFILFYETPPRFGRPPSFLKALFSSAAAGLVAFALARIF
jgi:hypothetical protein